MYCRLRAGEHGLERRDLPCRVPQKGRQPPFKIGDLAFDLLELLLFNVGIVLTREQIYERIWGFDFETSSKSLDVYISYLRRKTEDAGVRAMLTR